MKKDQNFTIHKKSENSEKTLLFIKKFGNDTYCGQTDEVRVFFTSLDTKLKIKTQSELPYFIFWPPGFFNGLRG